MIISQMIFGVQMATAELVIFPLANILVIFGAIVFMKHINEPAKADTY